jgi:hypothetical protein
MINTANQDNMINTTNQDSMVNMWGDVCMDHLYTYNLCTLRVIECYPSSGLTLPWTYFQELFGQNPVGGVLLISSSIAMLNPFEIGILRNWGMSNFKLNFDLFTQLLLKLGESRWVICLHRVEHSHSKLDGVLPQSEYIKTSLWWTENMLYH